MSNRVNKITRRQIQRRTKIMSEMKTGEYITRPKEEHNLFMMGVECFAGARVVHALGVSDRGKKVVVMRP